MSGTSQGLPQRQTAFVDQKTGLVNSSWYHFLHSIWLRTGAALGTAIDGVNIGQIVPALGTFTTLKATVALIGQGVVDMFASPPPIGSTAPSSGAFTTLSATSTISGAGFTAWAASPPAIGNAVAGTGTFTSLNATSVGATTPGTGAFTSLSTSGIATSHGVGAQGNYSISGGLAATNSWIFAQPFYFGSTTSNSLNYIGISDQVNASGTVNGLNVTQSVGGASTAGNRNALLGQLLIGNPPNPGYSLGGDYVGALGSVFVTTNSNGTFGTISPTSYKNGIFGLWSYPKLIGAKNYGALIGQEIDTVIDTNSSAAIHWGLAVVLAATHAKRGDYSDAALMIGAQGTVSSGFWKTGVSFGDPQGSWPLASDSTLLKIQPRLYGAPQTQTLQYGIDFRSGTFTAGGAAFASPNAQISETGALTANGVTTSGTVQAQTATLTGITINDGGAYSTIPTLTVQAPPSGGTTATVTVATVGGVANGPTGFLAFGATGKNYAVNDVLTYAGGTGTKPTFTVTAVNASGGITGVSVTTNGALTSAAANPIYPTGGAGTGAALNMDYTQSGATFIPATPTFAATGSGYVGGTDIITVVGDTGTAVKYAVATVDGFGGILTATVNTVGSLTVLAGGTYRTVTSTAAGVNASIQPAYKMLTFTITNAGLGYTASPPPIITSSNTGYKVADLTAVLTAAAAPLALNGMTLPATAINLTTTYANDAAAAAGGVAVGTVYRNGSVLQVRIV